MLSGEEFLDLGDVFPGHNPTHVFFQGFLETRGNSVAFNAYPAFLSCQFHFAVLFGSIK
jgi:hypothetical protein